MNEALHMILPLLDPTPTFAKIKKGETEKKEEAH